MNWIKTALSLMAITVSLWSCTNQQNMEQLVEKNLQFAAEQYKGMTKAIDDSAATPRTTGENGELETKGPSSWTSGFYPGILWYLYDYTQDSFWKKKACQKTIALESQKNNTTTHDLGFMLYCSYGKGYNMTQDTGFANVLVKGAKSLASRYNKTVGCIRSWSWGEWEFPVIIDNMMNLEYLFWATEYTGDSSFYNMAVNHANTTMEHHFREDYSTYHVVDYDTTTGEVLQKKTFQGAADSSAWARGQAWGLYGYTMAYRETGINKYLKQAQHIASFILNHPHLPKDMVPYWDFDAPNIPNAKRDASAAAIMSSALIELAQYTDGQQQKDYLKSAEKILRSLSSPKYRAQTGENNHFILKHAVGGYPNDSEIDVPLIYADYYYIEALLRYKKMVLNDQ